MSQNSTISLTSNFSSVYQIGLRPRPTSQSKSGNRYILTCMCLGVKYPEAIPMQRIDTLTVAESMTEIFSCAGIPAEILTDLGSVFMGKVTQEFCRMLPRKMAWFIKNILRKCGERKTEWDKILKYLLFVYRNIPHSKTGFSSSIKEVQCYIPNLPHKSC